MSFAGFTIAFVASLTAICQQPSKSTEKIIESYVEDFRTDRFANQPMLFGIEVPNEGQWHVRVTGERVGDNWGVELSEGPAPTPTWYYRVEAETLRAIDRGDINALTAQGKAFSTDYAPMDVMEMEGYAPTAEQNAAVNPFSFHFWTRGFPEVIPFGGGGMTRRAHGSNFVALYYENGLRTAWIRLEPGDRAREDPREMAMPFPMMAVGINGTAEGEVDGTRVSLPTGKTVFIPPNVMHRWWNEKDAPADAILIMFGEGA